jgi:hypothetical protein
MPAAGAHACMIFAAEFFCDSLQLPYDDKVNMHLTMGTLVIQGLFNAAFSLTLRVRDLKGDQRRIHLSTSVCHTCTRTHAQCAGQHPFPRICGVIFSTCPGRRLHGPSRAPADAVRQARRVAQPRI